MKALLFLVLSLTHAWASAQSSSLDGNWLKQGVDAFERAHISRSGTAEDLNTSTAFVSYLSGMVAVHRQNNLLAILLWSGAKKSTDKTGQVRLSEPDTVRIQTAAAFTPLRSLPDNLSPQQLVAVIHRFLDDHPEKWGADASSLVTEALRSAFSKS